MRHRRVDVEGRGGRGDKGKGRRQTRIKRPAGRVWGNLNILKYPAANPRQVSRYYCLVIYANIAEKGEPETLQVEVNPMEFKKPNAE